MCTLEQLAIRQDYSLRRRGSVSTWSVKVSGAWAMVVQSASSERAAALRSAALSVAKTISMGSLETPSDPISPNFALDTRWRRNIAAPRAQAPRIVIIAPYSIFREGTVRTIGRCANLAFLA
jgi:hypothetical protein